MDGSHRKIIAVTGKKRNSLLDFRDKFTFLSQIQDFQFMQCPCSGNVQYLSVTLGRIFLIRNLWKDNAVKFQTLCQIGICYNYAFMEFCAVLINQQATFPMFFIERGIQFVCCRRGFTDNRKCGILGKTCLFHSALYGLNHISIVSTLRKQGTFPWRSKDCMSVIFPNFWQNSLIS